MFRNGIGFDAHRFARERRLVLGGVVIDHPLGLLGHSDADVLCHAVMDALLGAIAEGDIGKHFPDSDIRWKDANSLDLLRAVTEMLRAKDWSVVNVDATVLAESPRISPYVGDMRANLAEAMGTTAEHVSIKATTLEGMGALGRQEGIAVMAVASVQKVAGSREVER